MEKITAIKGIKDILPLDSPTWHKVELTARNIFECFGFYEIRVPIMEKTTLFQRSIGETTDIVEKEMYTFRDRNDELLTLRPEATASVIRAYIEHNLMASDPVTKLYTIGPMFRRERPQKGRFRQFHQIDVELFGDDTPASDAEVIFMLMHFLQTLGIEKLSLEINSLGCKVCRPVFSKSVVEYLKGSEDALCPDCQRRIHTNPLRVFDCKVESCNTIIAGAPRILDDLCKDCSDHFSQVKEYLQDLKLSYEINPRMVRGLDYYTKTAFEVKSGELGAQNSLAGGGRYDGLVSFLGGPDVPGIGFGIGMERLIDCLPPSDSSPRRTDLFIAALGTRAQKIAFGLTQEFRRKGISAAMDYADRSLKSQMKRADKLNSAFTLIFGDKEIDESHAELRDMNTKNQKSLPLDGLLEELTNILNKRE
ncbi:MAG: Histidine--tRNA ligase [Deltaproteobacteria bacterium ADurb.Bin151]|jgi:histidyl-tRNA synthetase|nr:histidine--tRNA ligase [Smithella sp.]OQB56239.1 MAG: Histidine--tRNA ligase [Deltaproteobacteria bacterium ADurb.Bin151]